MLPCGNYVYHGGPSLIVLCGFFLLVFFHCKILLQTSILRVKTPNRAWGAVFKVWGPVTTYIEVGGEQQIWLFSLCGSLELSDHRTFLKITFLLLSVIAHARSTTRSLQIMILHCTCRFL